MSKKIYTAIMVLTLLIAGAAAAFGIQHSAREATAFWGDGYVLSFQSGENGAVVPAPIYFTAGTRYKTSYDGRISFKDMYGDKQEVSADAFIHYADDSISTFHSGVVMEMNELSRGLLNYYSLGEDSIMNRQGEGYLLDNQGTPLEFNDYVWKIEEDRFLVSSPELQLTLPDGSTEDLSGYLELEYVDKGIVRLSNSDRAFQILAMGSSLRLSDGSVLRLDDRSVEKDGQVNLYLQEILLDEMATSNIPVVPSETKPVKVPTFDITTIDGEEGAEGQDGETGEMGEEGEEGKSGDAGEAGEDGEEGEEGDEGDEGQDGNEGAEGDSGSDGKSGEAGSAGATGGTGGGGTGSSQDKVVMPVYVLSEFVYDITQASGTIDVDNAEDVNGVEMLGGTLSIIDTSDNTEIDSEEYDADQLSAFSPLEFSTDKLNPDSKYKIMLTASYRLTDSEAEADAEGERTFLTRTFSTTSFGILEEYGYATDNSLAVNLEKLEYAGNDPVRVVLLDKEGQEQGHISVKEEDWKETGKARTYEALFTELDSNTLYTVLVEVMDSVTGAYVEVSESEYRTLKMAPQVKKAPIVANNPKGYFEIRPDLGTEADPGIIDEDHAIIAYRYDIYTYVGQKAGTLVASVYGDGTTATAVYVDNKQIIRGEDYVARLVVEYNDNEKIVEAESEDSAPFFMDEQIGVPYLVFEETEEMGGVQYNQINGTMTVELNSAPLEISALKPLILTVYNEQFGEKDYYQWTTRPENLEKFSVPVRLTGLNSNTTYRFTLHGWYKDKNAGQQLATTIVKTPPSSSLKAVMKETSSMDTSIHPLNAEIWFDYGDDATTRLEGGQYEAQQISAISLTLSSGSQQWKQEIPCEITLTEGEWKNPDFPGADPIKYAQYQSDFPQYFKLDGEEEPREKLIVDNTTFNLADDAVIGSQYTLRVEFLYDYTLKDEYRYAPENTKPNKIQVTEKELVLRPIETMPDLPEDPIEVTQILRSGAEALGISLTEEMKELPPETVVGFALKPNYDNSGYYAEDYTMYAFDRTFYMDQIKSVGVETAKKPLEELKKHEPELGSLVWKKEKEEIEWGSTLPGLIFMMGEGNSGKVNNRDSAFHGYEYKFFPDLERGRRYVFAYDITLEMSAGTYTYPYDSTAYQSLPFPDGILRSEKGDKGNSDQYEAPRAIPVLKLYPHTVKNGTVSWQVNVKDPDGALHGESFLVNYAGLKEPIQAHYNAPSLPDPPGSDDEEKLKEAYGTVTAELEDLNTPEGSDREEMLVLSGNYILFDKGHDLVHDRMTKELANQPYRQYAEPVLESITQDIEEGNKKNALIFKLGIFGDLLPNKVAGVRLDFKPGKGESGLEAKTLYAPVSYVGNDEYQVEVSKDDVPEFFGKDFRVICSLLYPQGEYGYGVPMEGERKAILMTNLGTYISYDPENTRNPLTESSTVYNSMMKVSKPTIQGHEATITLKSPYDGDSFTANIPVTFTSSGAENSSLLSGKTTLVPVPLEEGTVEIPVDVKFDQITPVVSNPNATAALEEAVFTFNLTENVETLLDAPATINFVLSYRDENGTVKEESVSVPLDELEKGEKNKYSYTFKELKKGTTYTVMLKADLAGADSDPSKKDVQFLDTQGNRFTFVFNTLKEIQVQNAKAQMVNQYYNYKMANLTFGLSSVTGIQVRWDLYDATGVTDLENIPEEKLALSYDELTELQSGKTGQPYNPDKKRFYATDQDSLTTSNNYARLDLSGPIGSHTEVRLEKGNEYRWKISVYPKGTDYNQPGYEEKLAGSGWSNPFQYPQLNTPISQINIRPVPPENPEEEENRQLIVQPILGETPGDANGSVVTTNAYVVLDEKGQPEKGNADGYKLVDKNGTELTNPDKARGAYVIQLLEADYGKNWAPATDKPVTAEKWNLVNILSYCDADTQQQLGNDALHGMTSIELNDLKANWEYMVRIYAVLDPDLTGKDEITVPEINSEGVLEDFENKEGVTKLAEVTQRTVGKNGFLIDEERIDVEQIDANTVGINLYDAVGLDQVKTITGTFVPKAVDNRTEAVPLPELSFAEVKKETTTLSDGTVRTTIQVPASFAVKGTYNAVIRFYGEDTTGEPLLNRTYPLKVTDVAVRLGVRPPAYRLAALLPEKKQRMGKEKAHA